MTESLEQTGSLSKLKAKTRAEVLTVLNSTCNENDKSSVPRMTDEVLLVNELIREYLVFMEYKCTSSMLIVGKYCNTV